MHTQGRTVLLLILSALCLCACVSSLWTGANLIYDRHNIYNKTADFQLQANASRALYHDQLFKQKDVSIDLAVFHLDVLLVGRVPTMALRQEALERITALPGKRRLFNQLEVTHRLGNPIEDGLITTGIRGQILADADIDPNAFKVVTSEQIVYLMGDVLPEQAKKVIVFARSFAGVKRVVTLFKYYHLSDKPIA